MMLDIIRDHLHDLHVHRESIIKLFSRVYAEKNLSLIDVDLKCSKFLSFMSRLEVMKCTLVS
jgi:hypothetical protein